MKKVIVFLLSLLICINLIGCTLFDNKDRVNNVKDNNTEIEEKDTSNSKDKDKDNKDIEDSKKEDEETKKDKVSSVNITSKEKNVNKEYYKAVLSIPVISGMPKEGIQNELNSKLEDEILSFSKEFEKAGKEAYESSLKYEEPDFRPFTVDVSYKIMKNTNGILSLYIIYSFYTGGAHGMRNDIAYNIDINNGKILKLKDLFKEDYDYIEVINKEIDKEIDVIAEKEKKKQMDMDIDPEDIYLPFEEFESIDKNQSFYLKDNNIVIYFGLYEIAPYASGIPKFTIPINTLENGLKEDIKNIFN